MRTAYGKRFDIDSFMQEAARAYASYGNVPLVTLVQERGGSPFRILISAMLSARTRDETTQGAIQRLFRKADTPEQLARLAQATIEKLIYPVGFYKTKAPRIKAIAKAIINDFDGKVPRSMEELLTLPGVGRKTANLVLGEAFGIPAVCVDTHVHRISNRLGILQTRSPAETEQDLRVLLPECHWIRYNTYLVAHGQVVCAPRNPLCSRCRVRQFCRRVGVTTKK